jgi:ribosomal-protein-alanine acetyltransferase
MSGDGAEWRIRRMTEADLDRVMEIAEGLRNAPLWRRAAYRAGIDSEGMRRVCMVAEIDAGAKAQVDSQAVTARLKSCPDTKRAQGEVSRQGVKLGADRERGSFGSVVVGFAVASVVAPEAELETIAVAREWQRRGVARRLFAELSAELSAAGVQDVHLEVRESNETAVAFYRVLGFQESGRRRGYYADPVEDAVLLRLRLD